LCLHCLTTRLAAIVYFKQMNAQELALFVNYKQDESYTPNKLSIRAGTSFHDLREIDIVELMEPEGWLSIPLANADGTLVHHTHSTKEKGKKKSLKLNFRLRGSISSY
jgi:hypothetical protein